MSDESDTQAKAPAGPYTLRSRLEDPVTSSVEIGLDPRKWGIAVSTPSPPFAFGEIAAVVCTARFDAEAIALLFAASPDLRAALIELYDATTDGRPEVIRAARAVARRAMDKAENGTQEGT